MAGVASKNPYDLLNAGDEDSDAPAAPVKTVDKTQTHTAKRGADEAKVAAATTGAPRRAPGGSEGAFRDRNAGSDRNRSKPTDDASRGGSRGGHNARVRGGRGSSFRRDRDDRHSKSAPSGSEKQAAQSWGAAEGDAERKDEEAGEAIAQKEQTEDENANPAAEEATEPAEEEDHHISYGDWLAQETERKLALGDTKLNIRKVDSNTKVKKEWAAAKPITKKDEDEEFIPATGGKAKRERERKVKNTVEIDQRFVEQDRPQRGGGRGGRGEFRGSGRGGRGGRGDFRGDFRGGRGGGRGDFRGERGDFRGGRGAGGNSPALKVNDQAEFPDLGA